MKIEKVLLLGALAGVVLATGVYVGGQLGFLSTVGQGTSSTTYQTGQTCSSTGATTYTLVTGWENPATNSVEAVSTNYNIFEKDSALPMATGTTTSGIATLTDTLFCGKDYNVIVGDGSTYYFAMEKVVPTQASVSTKINLKKVGTAQLTVGNRTVLGGQTSVQVDMNAGSDNLDSTLEVQETDSGAYYGDGKILLAVGGEKSDYSEFAINSMNGLSVAKVSCPDNVVDSFTATYSNPRVQCFEVNKELYNGEIQKFQVKVVPSSTFNDATASTISLYVNDFASYIKNGQLVGGYIDASGSDIGASEVYLANAINPY